MKKIFLSLALTLSVATTAFAADKDQKAKTDQSPAMPGITQTSAGPAISSTLSTSIEKNIGNPTISNLVSKQMIQEVVPETVTTTSVSYVPESVPVTTYVPETVPVTTTDYVTTTTTWHPYYQKDPTLYSVYSSLSSTINASNYQAALTGGSLQVPGVGQAVGFGGGLTVGYGGIYYISGTNGYVPVGDSTFDSSIPVTSYVSQFTGKTKYVYVISFPSAEKFSYSSVGYGGPGLSGSVLPVPMSKDGNSGGAISTTQIVQNPSSAVQTYRQDALGADGVPSNTNIHATRVTSPLLLSSAGSGYPLVTTTDLGWTSTNVVTKNQMGTIISQKTSTANNISGPASSASAYGYATPYADCACQLSQKFSTVTGTTTTTKLVPTTTYTTETVPVTTTSSKTSIVTKIVPVAAGVQGFQYRHIQSSQAYPTGYPTGPSTSPGTTTTYGKPISSKKIVVTTGSKVVQKTVWKALPAPGAPTLARLHTGTSVSSFSNPISMVATFGIAALLPGHARAVWLGQIGPRIPTSFRNSHIRTIPIHHVTSRIHA